MAHTKLFLSPSAMAASLFLALGHTVQDSYSVSVLDEWWFLHSTVLTLLPSQVAHTVKAWLLHQMWLVQENDVSSSDAAVGTGEWFLFFISRQE